MAKTCVMNASTGLTGKKIIIGLSGSIAAYKSAFLVRLFIQAGAQVRVLMTPGATRFITPLTLSTLSKHEVWTDVLNENGWNNHVELGMWGDAFIIAPATANTLAKLASGQSDNVLVATYLSARCPVFVAPAMDVDMWYHTTTQRNIRQLIADGVEIIPAEQGELASGLIGMGRMAEPPHIFEHLRVFFRQNGPLLGKKALVTAGPTFEPIDPVRFIGNHSSGKMGIAIADALAQAGAATTLILGPSKLAPSHPNIQVVRVRTAQEMYEAAKAIHAQQDICILAAAVADYAPASPSNQKIKKTGDTLSLELHKTVDIASSLGAEKKPGQIHIGFALETENETAHALEKLKKKKFDFIVLNSLNDAGAGFNYDTNKVRFLFPDNKALDFELKSKQAVAADIVQQLVHLVQK